MILIETPAKDTPYQTQRMLLSGVDFEISWAWNSRTNSWTLSFAALGDGAEAPTPVLMGAKLHIGYDLLRRCRHPKRPLGSVWVYSTDGSREHPRMNELGTRVHVLYLEPGETLS